MAITVCPVTPDFVAEVYDVDLGQDLDAATVESIKSAFWKYAVLIFPEQRLTQEQHVRFAKHFGPMDHTVLKAAIADKKLRVREDIADVSNLDQDNRIWDANEAWRWSEAAGDFYNEAPGTIAEPRFPPAKIDFAVSSRSCDF